MSARTGSHQLSNGLIVSGRPDKHPKDRQTTATSCAVPYTGGDLKESGDLAKMYGLDRSSLSPSKHNNSGSAKSGHKLSNSGSMSKKSSSSSFSGPTVIQPTGLITSGPQRSNPRSEQLDSPASAPSSFKKGIYGSSVTKLGEDVKLGFRISRLAMWMFLLVVVMGVVLAALLVAAMNRPLIAVAVAAVLVPVVVIFTWNYAYRKSRALNFCRSYSDAELGSAINGQYVKVTGVVTCGSMALDTSFQKIPRCVYVSSELYEYRGFGGKPPNAKHCFSNWACTHSEKYVADFYISDFQSGLRAVVKAGNGAKVIPFVEPTEVVEDKKQLSPDLLKWLSDRGLSCDDRVIRLEESYIKEGSTVSVLGAVQRHENTLMIVAPPKPISTGSLLPSYIEGLVLMCDDSHNGDVIPI